MSQPQDDNIPFVLKNTTVTNHTSSFPFSFFQWEQFGAKELMSSSRNGSGLKICLTVRKNLKTCFPPVSYSTIGLSAHRWVSSYSHVVLHFLPFLLILSTLELVYSLVCHCFLLGTLFVTAWLRFSFSVKRVYYSCYCALYLLAVIAYGLHYFFYSDTCYSNAFADYGVSFKLYWGYVALFILSCICTVTTFLLSVNPAKKSFNYSSIFTSTIHLIFTFIAFLSTHDSIDRAYLEFVVLETPTAYRNFLFITYDLSLLTSVFVTYLFSFFMYFKQNLKPLPKTANTSASNTTNSAQVIVYSAPTTSNTVPYPANSVQYPPNAAPYPVNTAPYPANAAPYPATTVPYTTTATPYTANSVQYPPNPAPYPASDASYPPNSVQYPPTTAPYPPNAAPYPGTVAPYPANAAPYPQNAAPYPQSYAPYPAPSAPYPQAAAPYPEKTEPPPGDAALPEASTEPPPTDVAPVTASTEPPPADAAPSEASAAQQQANGTTAPASPQPEASDSAAPKKKFSRHGTRSGHRSSKTSHRSSHTSHHDQNSA